LEASLGLVVLHSVESPTIFDDAATLFPICLGIRKPVGPAFLGAGAGLYLYHRDWVAVEDLVWVEHSSSDADPGLYCQAGGAFLGLGEFLVRGDFFDNFGDAWFSFGLGFRLGV
jgi:hypothetical protein